MRHAIGLTVLFLTSIALTAAPVPKEKPVVKDEDAIVGTWAIEKFDGGDSKNPPPEVDVAKLRLQFKKDGKLLISGGPRGDDKSGEYKLDPKAKVKSIDITVPNEPPTVGIYELKDDILKLCVCDGNTNERPTEFVPVPQKDIAVLTLKRVKDEAKAEPAKEEAKPVPEKVKPVPEKK